MAIRHQILYDDDDERIRTHAHNNQQNSHRHTRTHIRSIYSIIFMSIASFFYHFHFLRLEKWREKKTHRSRVSFRILSRNCFYFYLFFFRSESTDMWSNQKPDEIIIIFFSNFEQNRCFLEKVNETNSDAECLPLLHFRLGINFIEWKRIPCWRWTSCDRWFTIQPNRSIFPSIFWNLKMFVWLTAH